LHPLTPVRVVALAMTGLLGLAAPAGAAQQERPAPFELTSEVRPYYIDLLPQFALGDLVDRDCTALYAPRREPGCVYFTGEEFWIHASLTAKAPIRVRPDSPGLARADVELDGTPWRRFDLAWQPHRGQQPDSDGYVMLQTGESLTFRTDLSAALGSWTGSVRVCVSTDPLRRRSSTCWEFVLADGSSTAGQVETWRRRGGAALAAFDCDAAREAAARMLAADPNSAAGYRVRGIVAELERRQQDAIADYAMAIGLLRSGEDRWLTMSDDQRPRSAESLEDWLSGMQMAQGHSLLGEGSEAYRCRR
jgi:hypothetical protein